MKRYGRWCALIALPAILIGVFAAWSARHTASAIPANALISQGWTDITRQSLDAAAEKFNAAGMTGVSREADLGLAMSILNAQPVTDAKVQRAAEMLDSLRNKNSADDEISVEATFALARLEQLHRDPPAFDRALALYDELVRAHPQHPLGQMAIVKAGMIRLFQGADRAAALRVFADVESQVGALTETDARRDGHLMLAGAATLLKLSDEKTLSHLVAADHIGFARRKTAADVFVHICEVAQRLKQSALAREYYSKFVTEFPHDPRTFLIQQRLREFALTDAGALTGALPEKNDEAVRP